MNNKEVTLEEIFRNANLAEGLDLDMPTEDYEEEDDEMELRETPEKTRETDGRKDGHWCPPCKPLKSMKISCDLEVAIGAKNKVIYVCPGKLQYFTASAISCSGDESIEIEYTGHNTKCVYGETFICGSLGYYKIVKSGIIFIPNNYLSESPDHSYPTDILPFKAKSRCDKDVEFVVVFTYSRCIDCECSCGK